MSDGAGTGSSLLLHYHIFKNAGSSIDRMLHANFGESWLAREFEVGTRSERHRQVCDLLARSPHVVAFSSHTAPMPVPELPGRCVLPIIFVRHPLLRIRSAYAFHRRQKDGSKGATLAAAHDLRGYVESYLADPKARLVRDFQALRFAAGTPGPPARLLPRALETISRLPFVGLVEAYDESLVHLEQLVRLSIPAFRATVFRENATALAEGTVSDSLAALRDELGDSLFERLLSENATDLALFEHVRARYRVAA